MQKVISKDNKFFSNSKYLSEIEMSFMYRELCTITFEAIKSDGLCGSFWSTNTIVCVAILPSIPRIF
ncbi:MAG: hypothetical protein C0397_11690 [Odoribacter sp.]|nr:hypothetical protein [Odoribacter sp.]